MHKNFMMKIKNFKGIISESNSWEEYLLFCSQALLLNDM